MPVKTFLHRPQTVWLRRALFQVHLAVGILTGLYVFVVCATGAALVFRIDVQRALHPDLFTPASGAAADAATMLESVRDAFPGYRVSGIEAPTALRPTSLAYVVGEGRFLTLLFDPVSARLLGELPERSFIRTLQELHFNLLAGRAGRVVNGMGASLLLVLCVSGAVIWWPGVLTWRRGLGVRFDRSWRRVIRELHGAAGIWTLALTAMWAITGLSFAFPAQFRATVGALSPLTASRAPTSGPPEPFSARPPTWRELIARAEREAPGQHVARVILPANRTAAFLVVFSPAAPSPVGRAALTSVYLDQYTGAVLASIVPGARTLGDLVIEWTLPLHIGTFGGLPSRVAWATLGLAPPLLFVTGFVMWWTRVVRPRHRAE